MVIRDLSVFGRGGARSGLSALAGKVKAVIAEAGALRNVQYVTFEGTRVNRRDNAQRLTYDIHVNRIGGGRR